MTKNFIMKYVMESTGGMNAMANSFVDSTMQKVRMNFRVKDIGTKKMEAKEDSLYKKIETIFPRDKHDISVTGSSVIFFKGNQYLIKNLFKICHYFSLAFFIGFSHRPDCRIHGLDV